MAIPFGNSDHSFTEKPCNSFWGEGPDHPSRQRLLERTLFLGSLLNPPPPPFFFFLILLGFPGV